jgi:hypothetical protein
VRPSRLLRRLALAAPLAITACGTRAPSATAPVPERADPCAVGDTLGVPPDTVRVALLEPVDAGHAPVPVNGTERLVFRQLYETPVRVDCAGNVRPALASRWHSVGDTLWSFALRPGARFWDGTPVDAEVVAHAWRAQVPEVVRSVRAVGGGAIEVTLATPRSIEAFGDPAWSVVKPISVSPWPLGTTPVWVRDWEVNGADSVLWALPLPDAPPATPTLRFGRTASTDPRDLIDSGADALLTRDAGVLRYADGRPAWRTVPLAWDRLYSILSPARLRHGVTAQLGADTRAALARDAVRADAQPYGPRAETADWWQTPDCGVETPIDVSVADGDAARVAFPAHDQVADDLAGRFVARADAELATLVGATVAPHPRAAPLDAPAFRAQLAAGTALVFIAPLPLRPLDPCRAIADLVASAPWLANATGTLIHGAVVPLVETRGYLLLRNGIAASLDADGGARLIPERRP